ncbi:MAG: isochorismatase family protein [Acidobacteriota bacterium]
MARTIFWDVDTQYDFLMPDGKLTVPDAVKLLPNLACLTQTARQSAGKVQVVASADDHEMTDAEISTTPDFRSTFPPHCMRGTVGQMRVNSTELANPMIIGHQKRPPGELRSRIQKHGGELVVVKKTIDVFSNPNCRQVVEILAPQTVYLFGVFIDYCVMKAVEGLLQSRVARLFLVRDATDAIDRNRGEELLAKWKREGVELVTTEEVCRAMSGA